MRFVKTAPGEEFESIVDYRTIEFSDIILQRGDVGLFKYITLLMYEGLSQGAKNASNSREYLKTMHPAIEWLGEYPKPVEMYRERKGLTNFGGIEINPSDVALYLFHDDLSLDTDEWASKNHYLNVVSYICEEVRLNEGYQNILMDEIRTIIGDIKRYEQITDIVLGIEFKDFVGKEPHIANDDDRFTVSELSDYWGMTDANIRMAIRNRRFNMNVIEKRMGTYLIPKYEMDRVFGDYAIYNIKKIKKSMGFEKSSMLKYKTFIRRCVKELDELLDFELEGIFKGILGVVPMDSYEELKLLMVEILKSKSSNDKKMLFKAIVESGEDQRPNLNQLLEMDDILLYIAVFEKFIKRQNKKNEVFKKGCKDTYLTISTDLEPRFAESYRLNTLSKRYNLRIYRAWERYVKELKFDVHGLSENDIGNFGSGFEIGEMHATFYNVAKMKDEGVVDSLEKVISSLDELSEDMYHMLLDNGDLAYDIDLVGNIMYIHVLTLKEEYDKPETIRLIMKNLYEDMDYLYDYRVDTLCLLIRYSDKESLKYRNTLKNIGFKEVENEEYSLLCINTKDPISNLPIENNEFTPSDPKAVEIDESERVIGEIVVDGHYFHQLRPYFKGDIERWVFREEGRTIRIQNRYNKTWVYEDYDTSGKRASLAYYGVDQYDLMGIFKIAIRDMHLHNHFYDMVAEWKKEKSGTNEF